MYKVKVFLDRVENSPALEEKINRWLAEHGAKIEIKARTQSSTEGYVTVIYHYLETQTTK